MSNPIFNAIGGNNLLSQLNQLKNNPVQFLMSRRYNIPDDLSGNPQGIVQHLLNSGQMSQETYSRLQSQVNQIVNTNRARNGM